MPLIDITPPITERLRVWPGDTPPTREVLLDMQQGDNITLSTLHSTVHVGAHADGANHYGKDAPGIDGRPLDVYVGRCQVVHVAAERGTRLTVEQLGVAITEERVLIATGTYPDPEQFNEDFTALDPGLVDALHEQGVRLVGVDTPSVDTFTSKDLPSHARFLANDMAILEGLVLSEVPSGAYELIALPLSLPGFDASPVRAVLRTL
ncbi:MAG: cyclase family protein [Planctomycetota bacterium]